MSFEIEFQNLNIGAGSSTGAVDGGGVEDERRRAEEVEQVVIRAFELSKEGPHEEAVAEYLEREIETIERKYPGKFVDSKRFTPLHNAAREGDEVLVRAILKKSERGFFGTPADTTVDGWTPLHFAASKGVEGVIDALVRAGSNLEAKNKRWETPLAVAKRKEHGPDVLELLGDVVIAQELTPEEVEVEKLKQAKENGNYIDLTVN